MWSRIWKPKLSMVFVNIVSAYISPWTDPFSPSCVGVWHKKDAIHSERNKGCEICHVPHIVALHAKKVAQIKFCAICTGNGCNHKLYFSLHHYSSGVSLFLSVLMSWGGVAVEGCWRGARAQFREGKLF